MSITKNPLVQPEAINQYKKAKLVDNKPIASSLAIVTKRENRKKNITKFKL